MTIATDDDREQKREKNRLKNNMKMKLKSDSIKCLRRVSVFFGGKPAQSSMWNENEK